MKDAIKLAEYLRDLGYMPEQVQDFYPTPSTISTCMYYTGYDPRTMEKVYVPKNPHEKLMQRALIQYRDPKNYDLVHEALVSEGRYDLIGFGRECLIKPRNMAKNRQNDEGRYGSRIGNGKQGDTREVVNKAGNDRQGNIRKADNRKSSKKSTIRNKHKSKTGK
jgi:2,4-dienoyl-CoA reductase-like NADH-dependent reductase (Old Yellow Enzyme family)